MIINLVFTISNFESPSSKWKNVEYIYYLNNFIDDRNENSDFKNTFLENQLNSCLLSIINLVLNSVRGPWQRLVWEPPSLGYEFRSEISFFYWIQLFIIIGPLHHNLFRSSSTKKQQRVPWALARLSDGKGPKTQSSTFLTNYRWKTSNPQMEVELFLWECRQFVFLDRKS